MLVIILESHPDFELPSILQSQLEFLRLCKFDTICIEGHPVENDISKANNSNFLTELKNDLEKRVKLLQQYFNLTIEEMRKILKENPNNSTKTLQDKARARGFNFSDVQIDFVKTSPARAEKLKLFSFANDYGFHLLGIDNLQNTFKVDHKFTAEMGQLDERNIFMAKQLMDQHKRGKNIIVYCVGFHHALGLLKQLHELSPNILFVDAIGCSIGKTTYRAENWQQIKSFAHKIDFTDLKEEQIQEFQKLILDKLFSINSQITPLEFKELGNYLFGKGYYKNALKCYDHALNTSTDNEIKKNCLHNKGMALVKLQRFLEAVAVFDQVLKIDSKYIKALYNQACAFESIPEKEKNALDNYEKILQIDPNQKDTLDKKKALLERLKQQVASSNSM